jgi:hypothetical protein
LRLLRLTADVENLNKLVENNDAEGVEAMLSDMKPKQRKLLVNTLGLDGRTALHNVRRFLLSVD